MFRKIKLLFNRKFRENELIKWDTKKSIIMEQILGEQYENVVLSLIPYDIGGELSMYYYEMKERNFKAFAIATKDLSILPESGPSNKKFRSYELVMFLNFSINLEKMLDSTTSEGVLHLEVKSILNSIAPYAEKKTLNQYDTLEFKKDINGLSGRCFVFDAFNPVENDACFGMMAIIEISNSTFTKYNGKGKEIIENLKSDGLYPISLL